MRAALTAATAELVLPTDRELIIYHQLLFGERISGSACKLRGADDMAIATGVLVLV